VVYNNKTLRYRKRTERLSKSVERVSAAAQLYEKSHLKTFIIGEELSEMALCDLLGLLVVSSNNVCILHRFRNIITFAAYLSTFFLEKSFMFYNVFIILQLNIIGTYVRV